MTSKVSLHLLLLLLTHLNFVHTSSSETTELALTDPFPTLSCSSDQFACLDGWRRCIPNEYLCDGDADCKDASDETVSVCPDCAADPSKLICKESGKDMCKSKAEWFACLDGSKCISRSDLCDGDADCNDASDETESACQECAADPSKFICKHYGKDICKSKADWFACSNGVQCIRRLWLCDGGADCADASDETESACQECAADTSKIICTESGKDRCKSKSEWFACLEKNFHSIQQTKSMEVGREAI